MLYFDHNATAPLCAVAREAWLEATERFPGNPSSPHRVGARAAVALEGARERLARLLGCEPWEIVWTSGATEAVNLAVAHLSSLPGGAGSEAWVSAVEHPCVLASVRRAFGKRVRLLPVGSDGVVRLDFLADALRQGRPALVAVMAANNETGVLQPWKQAASICRDYGVPLLCDSAQWMGREIGGELGQCDFVAGCAHKVGAPAGVGFLRCATAIRPLLVGGPQEEGRRAGTENLAGVLALVATLEACERSLHAGVHDQHRLWRREFEAEITAQGVGCELVSTETDRLWNTVSAVMPDQGCRQRWVVRLDGRGCAVSTGSACSSGREHVSPVLTAMGIPPERAGRVLRFSSGWGTTRQDWQQLARVVRECCEQTGRPESLVKA